jgi:excisionase family DNA binding protein
MAERYEGEADALRQRIIELVAEREVWQTRISQLERIVKETTAAKELIAELRRRTESAEQRVQVHKDFLTSDEAATYMRVSKQTLAKLRCERKSPPYRKVGGRVLYERTELEKWMDMPRRGNYT